MLEDGDFASDVKLLMGANKHEGIFCADFLYGGFIRPNNLINDTEFLANEAVPLILKALGILI